MIHSFLLIGQSNMAGRGHFGEVEPLPNDRQFVMRNGRWQPLFTPVNPDRPFSGVCLGESFAYDYAADFPDRQVGLVPCADGGTQISQWAKGSLLYDHAVMMASLASRTSSLDALLWHQGETDCAADRYPLYEERLVKLIADLRRDLSMPDIPFIMGGLGDFLPGFTADATLVNYRHINDAMGKVSHSVPGAVFVPADGLGSNPDCLHFSAAALREFGHRYYRAYRAAVPAAAGVAAGAPEGAARGKEDGFIVNVMEKL
jgi:hypothetical protein